MNDVLHALRYPFAIDARAGRGAEETDYDAYVRGLIRQVLLTEQGERVNRPDFGAGIRRMVFAPISPAASMAQTLVYQALTRWLSTVIRVEDVQVTARAETLLIEVRYFVLRRGETQYLNEEVAL